MSVLPPPSDEQQVIIESFRKGNNVKINAVSGSGKTTTLFHLALVASEKKQKTLIVTYNKALQVEVTKKAFVNNLSKWVEIKTIHSAAGRAYSSGKGGRVVIIDDKSMFDIKEKPLPDGSLLRGFQVIMVDEAQDLSEERAIFLQKITKGKQIVLVGDPLQNIYSYVGTTPEYFLNAELYFKSENKWISASMITSYRLPPTMGRFIDNHVMGDNPSKKVRFIGGNKHSKDTKVRIYAYNHPNLTRITNRIFKIINSYGVEGTAIIVPTVAKRGESRPTPNSPLGKIVCMLSEKGIVPAFVCGSSVKDSEGSFEAGKLVISTWASFKGREKDAIIVMGADEGYFRFFARDWTDPQNIPNVVYVALTRARKEMVVLVDIDSGPLRTFNLRTIEEVAEIKGKLAKKNIDPMDRYSEQNVICVTDALKHRRVNDVIGMLKEIIEGEVVDYDKVPIKDRYTIPFVSKTDSGDRQQLSFVGNYYGTVITELAEYELTKKCRGRLYQVNNFILAFLQRHLEKIGNKKSTNTDRKLLIGVSDITIIKVFSPEMVELRKQLLSLDFDKDYEQSEEFLIKSMLPEILKYVSGKDKRKDSAIRRIIKAMDGDITPLKLMEVVCYTDAFQYPYLSTVFGDLGWVDCDFIHESCNNLKKYITSLGDEIGTFEVPIKVTLKHPHLSHLGIVKRIPNSLVKVKINESELSYDGITFFDSKGLEIVKSSIVTADPFKLSNRKLIFNGRIDYIDNNGNIHEFKVGRDDPETYSLQLGAYLAMANKKMGYLYNVATGQQRTYSINMDSEGENYGNVFLCYLSKGMLNWDEYIPGGSFQPLIKRKKK